MVSRERDLATERVKRGAQWSDQGRSRGLLAGRQPGGVDDRVVAFDHLPEVARRGEVVVHPAVEHDEARPARLLHGQRGGQEDPRWPGEEASGLDDETGRGEPGSSSVSITSCAAPAERRRDRARCRPGSTGCRARPRGRGCRPDGPHRARRRPRSSAWRHWATRTWVSRICVPAKMWKPRSREARRPRYVARCRRGVPRRSRTPRAARPSASRRRRRSVAGSRESSPRPGARTPGNGAEQLDLLVGLDVDLADAAAR